MLAVVLRGDGSETRALIVQRAQQPNAGRWGFPGGVLELGETVGEGAMRELLEETGIVAEPAGILNVHDAISRDAEGRVQFHYLLIAVRGIWQSGEGEPADDAAACAWVSRDDIVAGPLSDLPDAAAAVRPRDDGRGRSGGARGIDQLTAALGFGNIPARRLRSGAGTPRGYRAYPR